ncbi:MAG: acylneuraminate cytidylyltransferase family protein [Candidatus Omnitrophica bacterium]|nr:acylneuraminate cytidylyltransferase family protein [Candidatus Omnitrophota bacterium]
MFENQRILSFIGARSGSKGLKDKNILPFAGKPLIHWTVVSSLNSDYIDRTLVSTDGENIARAARKSGADVPFLRPAAFATDQALIEDALRHALDWFKKHEKQVYDYILLLQPTAPLRTTQHIDQAIEFYFKQRKTVNDTLVSVTQAPFKAGWLMEQKRSGYIDYCFDIKGQKRRRQNIPSYYLPNGLIYLAPVSVIRRGSFYSLRTIPFVMDESVSVDIDERSDFDRALKLFRGRKT